MIAEKTKTMSNILVTIQFGAIAAMALTGPWIASTWYLLIPEAAGLLLGLYAIYIMRPGNFNIRPSVKEDGKLVTHGPYRFIRHPMYTAIIFVLYPLLIEHFTYLRLSIMVVLTINLVVKQIFEEGLLKTHFNNYPDYMKSTNRMIPGVF
ncbi:MAG: isoprenylcysteine carboxylmethyltransferase family protein [Bacteroidales bacterium]|nr:isoprenylcysteine carboxylmethyltransferase family protein [Bacteroidales bacterium]MCF8336879.1 isoprenylcysteine carboxylmethyltransferase family protein [Bacteroidales bacterium]